MPSFVAVGVNDLQQRNTLIGNCILINHGVLVNQLKSTGSSLQIAERSFAASQPPQVNNLEMHLTYSDASTVDIS